MASIGDWQYTNAALNEYYVNKGERASENMVAELPEHSQLSVLRAQQHIFLQTLDRVYPSPTNPKALTALARTVADLLLISAEMVLAAE